MPAGRPLKFESPEELQVLIDAYFKECKEDKRPYTMAGLAYALKVDRQTIINYERKEEFFDTIKDARCRVEQYVEEMLFENKGAGPIFNLKNNFALWKDKSEVDTTVHLPKPILSQLEIDED